MSAPHDSEESWSAQAAPEPESDRPSARPRGVPESARWMEEVGEWHASALDADGRLHGPFRAWRADGSLRAIARHEGGKRVDVTWEFHPDGSLFSVGAFTDGTPRGVHRRYANLEPTAERLQSCCVPAGAWQLRQDFQAEGAVDRRWYDRDGARLLDSGNPYPELPKGVPENATFSERSQYWEAGLTWADGGYHGTRRRWSREGVLLLIEETVASQRHGVVRWFDEHGAPVYDATYDKDRLSGPFRAHQVAPHYFTDAALGAYEGTFADDQAIGAWRVFRADGTVAATLDLGHPVTTETLAVALADVERNAEEWAGVAAAARAKGQVLEYLLATARQAARSGNIEVLRRALATHALPLGAEAARAAAAELIERTPEDVIALADGLRRGMDPAELLVALAKAVPDSDRAALDLATAAVLLAPGAAAPLAARALLRGSAGDPAGVREDIESLRAASADQAAFLDLYQRAYFPTFDFWPARELAAENGGEAPSVGGREAQEIGIYRSVDEVREVMRRYATRLARLRGLIEARVEKPGAVALPDVTALLAGGRVELSRWSFSMSAAAYGGQEQDDGDASEATIPAGAQPQDPGAPSSADTDDGDIEIVVDESLDLDLDGAQLLRVLRRTRADWAGLTWLCWAVGLDRVALPESISAPPALGQQALSTLQRAWRCRDKLNTSGLLAMTKGVPGFDWEGTPIDLLPKALVDVPLGEYLERRAMFAWLCDPANRSPWQDDLRGDD